MDILLLSPYDCMSHRYWRLALAKELESRLEAAVTVRALPARFFSWRQRGNSLSFAADDQLQRSYDLIIATSMTDLSALRGLNRHLATTPAVVYFHENQFAYPDRVPAGLIERQLTSIYSALSADVIVFNSDWNARSFFKGARRLLKKMPDGVPKGIVDQLERRFQVIPVALIDRFPDNTSAPDGLDIVWNHRWEYDKGPEELLAIVERLIDIDATFRMSLLGQRFDEVPVELQRVQSLLVEAGKLWHNRFVEDRDEYLNCLAAHHVVLSTSAHEFQGLSVQEALRCGCKPLVPDSLVYPEYVPVDYRFNGIDDAISRLKVGLPDYSQNHLAATHPDSVGDAWQRLIGSLKS